MKKLSDRIASLVSALTSPFVTITLFALWVIRACSAGNSQFAVLVCTFIILIILLPLCWVMYGVRTGKFTDLHVMIQEQRTEPFVVATVGAILLAIAFHFEHAPAQLMALAWSLVVNGIVFLLLTQFWKVSMHAAAYSASVLIVALVINPIYYLLLLGIPIIIWARLRRKRHNIYQSISAVAIVMATTWCTFRLLGIA